MRLEFMLPNVFWCLIEVSPTQSILLDLHSDTITLQNICAHYLRMYHAALLLQDARAWSKLLFLCRVDTVYLPYLFNIYF